MTRPFATLVAFGLALALGTAHATTEAQKEHQKKFGDCSKQSKGKKGDERKTFMKECMKKEN